MKVLLDVDTGVDDAAALLYMLFKPQYDIVGIGTVCGNVEARLAAENTLKVLDLADAPDIRLCRAQRNRCAADGPEGCGRSTEITGWEHRASPNQAQYGRRRNRRFLYEAGG